MLIWTWKFYQYFMSKVYYPLKCNTWKNTCCMTLVPLLATEKEKVSSTCPKSTLLLWVSSCSLTIKPQMVQGNAVKAGATQRCCLCCRPTKPMVLTGQDLTVCVGSFQACAPCFLHSCLPGWYWAKCCFFLGVPSQAVALAVVLSLSISYTHLHSCTPCSHHLEFLSLSSGHFFLYIHRSLSVPKTVVNCVSQGLIYILVIWRMKQERLKNNQKYRFNLEMHQKTLSDFCSGENVVLKERIMERLCLLGNNQRSRAVLSRTVATSHVWLLSTRGAPSQLEGAVSVNF